MNTHVPENMSQKGAKPTPHKCAHCNKGFAKPSQLERHVRVHTGNLTVEPGKLSHPFVKCMTTIMHTVHRDANPPYFRGRLPIF